MPLYTGDKIGFGVAPVEEGDGAPEVGYSTSFDNRSHSKRIEHKWTVPKTARYNFEVWGADGGMGVEGNGDNNNGGIPRYGRGGKVECSFLLAAGTELGIMVGDNGLPAFYYSSSNNGTFNNNGEGGWGGYANTLSLADGGNSNYNTREFGGSASNPRNYRGGGGGGGTIVRLYQGSTNSDIMIVAGGGGGAGGRGDDHTNSNNQGGSGGNANDKMNETQYGRRGYYAGDTSYGWPSGNAVSAYDGNMNGGGNGGSGYYAGGGGGGGGFGGGGGAATCTYCGGQGGSGGGIYGEGAKGSANYNQSSGGGGTSEPSGIDVVGPGGSSNPNGNGHGGGGGGGFAGGGAGYWGNGQGHAGGGGGGGGSSWCSTSNDVKGLNGLTANPRFTSEQKPMRLGNPGGGKVFIWEADKDPLGKNRPAEMTSDKIQYLCRSSNGGASNSQRLYYIGSASNGSSSDGGDPDYTCYNSHPYQTANNKCDAIVMEIDGTGLWELHSVTVGQGQSFEYPLPYKHQCWVHVIEGTETGGVGIHTEKFDANNTTGDGVDGWYAHRRACSKQQNTNDGYIELFFEKPAVLNRGQKYTVALDWSCGGTVSGSNQGGIAGMYNGAVSQRALIGSQKGTCIWTNVTAYNGPHGLGSKNSDNSMETSISQGQMVHFGVRSVYVAPTGGGGSTTYYKVTQNSSSGHNSYVDLGANMFPSNAYLQYTVEAWCRPLIDPTSGETWVVDQHPDGNGRLIIGGASGGNVGCFMGNGWYSGNVSFGNTTDWAHIAWVANGDGSVTIFKNGVSAGTSGTGHITTYPTDKNTIWGQDTSYGGTGCEYRGFRINSNRLYTSNFTPPSIEGGLTNISGTLALWDGLTGSAHDASGNNTWSATNMTFSELGAATHVTSGLIFNVDASDSNSYSGSGNTWTDIQGSNNVTLTNCSYTSANGGGITFDGVSNWSIGEFNTPFSASDYHTWEVWTNGEWTTGWPGSPYTWILHNSSQGQSTGSSYMTIGINDANQFFGANDGKYGSMNVAAHNSTNATIYHLMLTWDGSMQKFYVNGTLGNSYSLGAYSQWQNNASFNTTTTMGEAIGGNYRPLKGNIYSVRCWNRALSATEVTTNWNGNKAKFGH